MYLLLLLSLERHCSAHIEGESKGREVLAQTLLMVPSLSLWRRGNNTRHFPGQLRIGYTMYAATIQTLHTLIVLPPSQKVKRGGDYNFSMRSK